MVYRYTFIVNNNCCIYILCLNLMRRYPQFPQLIAWADTVSEGWFIYGLRLIPILSAGGLQDNHLAKNLMRVEETITSYLTTEPTREHYYQKLQSRNLRGYPESSDGNLNIILDTMKSSTSESRYAYFMD